MLFVVHVLCVFRCGVLCAGVVVDHSVLDVVCLEWVSVCCMLGISCVACCAHGRKPYLFCAWFPVSGLVIDVTARCCVKGNVLCSQLHVCCLCSFPFSVLACAVSSVFSMFLQILIVCCVVYAL